LRGGGGSMENFHKFHFNLFPKAGVWENTAEDKI
jgi:hypothetical protein